MALPHFTKMIPHIVCFGVDGDIDGRELRRRLPEIMNISAEDLAIRQPRGADTMFEMYVRHRSREPAARACSKI